MLLGALRLVLRKQPANLATCRKGSGITTGIKYNESDSLAVIVSMTNKDEKIPMNGVDDLVLINGYNDNEPHLLATACCPGSKPPPFD